MKIQNNQTGNTFLIGLLVLVLIGAGVLMYMRVSDSTTDTDNNTNTSQTNPSNNTSQEIPDGFVEYTNEDLGVSFGVPEDAKASDVTNIDAQGTSKSSQFTNYLKEKYAQTRGSIKFEPGDYWVQVTVSISGGRSLEEFAAAGSETEEGLSFELVDIGDIKAAKAVTSGGDTAAQTYFAIVDDLEVTVLYQPDTADTQQIAEPMLATMKRVYE